MQRAGQPEGYEPSYYLLEEARKSWNYAISDKSVYVRDPIEVARDSVADVAKDYIKGNLWIECHLTFELQRDAHHLLVVIEFDRSHKIVRHQRKVKSHHVTMNRNPSVFVDIAQPVKPPEQVRRWLRSVVRLKRIDELCCPCGYARRAGGKGLSRSSVAFFENWKFRSLGVRSSESSKRPNELIERGPKTVEQISQNQRDGVGRVGYLDPNLIPATLNIVLTKNGAGFGFAEQIDLVPQSVKVYLRPGCLQVGINQTRRNRSNLDRRHTAEA